MYKQSEDLKDINKGKFICNLLTKKNRKSFMPEKSAMISIYLPIISLSISNSFRFTFLNWVHVIRLMKRQSSKVKIVFENKI